MIKIQEIYNYSTIARLKCAKQSNKRVQIRLYFQMNL